MTVSDFSFAEHASNFDEHISQSIPGYDLLFRQCVRLSRRFVQAETSVVDVGCSTGSLLKDIRDHNRPARSSVRYIGIDIEGGFADRWAQTSAEDVHFEA